MDEKDKIKEEILSRRAFFKKATNLILPVIGGVLPPEVTAKAAAAPQFARIIACIPALVSAPRIATLNAGRTTCACGNYYSSNGSKGEVHI